ncbi:MAG: tetraacyldisaccharide 4'-kinase [Bacteroidales bacterium]|nr:tetraacyldisaccharide 4'-kinase [Bacteroidales bacterium]
MIYRLVLALRHLFYDKGWKKSFTAAVPTVCLGNITVGGTGKTPHTEMILGKLQENQVAHLAVLSRGYKRRSRGFQVAGRDATAALVGDEPLQIARKFPSVTVAVDKDRLQGCEKLMALQEPPVAIILDDAFQYRKLRATLNIVLVDYNRPVFKDSLMPWGHLRDLPSRIRRAQIVIVSKCPSEISSEERAEWRKNLGLTDSQELYFTTVSYCEPEAVFPEADVHYLYSQRLVLVSGIADNMSLRMHLSDKYLLAQRLDFPDHHRFSRADIRAIASAVKANPTACLMTTEKDAQRLRDCKKIPPVIREKLFYLPIKATFLTPEEDLAFTASLLKAVGVSVLL